MFALAAGADFSWPFPQVDVGSVLGEGGFATVYRVIDVLREEPLALKHFQLGCGGMGGWLAVLRMCYWYYCDGSGSS